MKRLYKYASLLALLLIWQVIAQYIYPIYNPNSERIFPPPSAVIETAWQMASTGELFSHIAASVRRVFAGFMLAAIVAIPLGLSMGAWPKWRKQLNPLLEILRPVPPFAWIPISLLWFGVGDSQSIFVIFIATIFPILLNTVSGVDSVNTIHIRAAQCLGASRKTLFVKVVLMSALPSIFVGLRTGLGLGWMVLVASELIGAVSGLGYLINDSRNMGIPDLAFMGMIMIGVIGLCIEFGARKLEQRLIPWYTQ